MDDPAIFIGSAISTLVVVFIAFKNKKKEPKMTFKELNESELVQTFKKKRAREAAASPLQRLENGDYHLETRGALPPKQERIFLGFLFAWLNANEHTSLEFRNQTPDLQAQFDAREGTPIDLFDAAGGKLRVSLLQLKNIHFLGFLYGRYFAVFSEQANTNQDVEPTWSNYDHFCPLFDQCWKDWNEYNEHRRRP